MSQPLDALDAAFFQRLQQHATDHPPRALTVADAPQHRLPDGAAIAALAALGSLLPAAGTRSPTGPHGHPPYPPQLVAFFTAASDPAWSVQAYDPPFVGRCLRSPGALEASDLAGLCLMLTWMVRGERFCDGHWGAMLEQGHLQRWLARLARLA